MVVRGKIKFKSGYNYSIKGRMTQKPIRWWQFWIPKDYIPEKHPEQWEIKKVI